MEIRNKTLYDKNLIVRYNHYYLIDFLKKNSFIIVGLAVAFGIYLLIIKEWKYALILLGLVVVYFGLAIGMQLLTTKKVLKRSPLVKNPIMQTYVFNEEGIDIINLRTRTLVYSAIVRIKESKEFMIIIDNEKKTYIVSKEGFASVEETNILRNFLKGKIGKRYR